MTKEILFPLTEIEAQGESEIPRCTRRTLLISGVFGAVSAITGCSESPLKIGFKSSTPPDGPAPQPGQSAFSSGFGEGFQ